MLMPDDEEEEQDANLAEAFSEQKSESSVNWKGHWNWPSTNSATKRETSATDEDATDEAVNMRARCADQFAVLSIHITSIGSLFKYVSRVTVVTTVLCQRIRNWR